MGNALSNYLRDKDFKYANATIAPEGNRIVVKWNKLKNVKQYNVEVWCNQVLDRTEIASEPFFSACTKHGRRFHFKITPKVCNAGGSQEQRSIDSNAVYTTPSPVTDIHITESNGLQMTWRKPDSEDVKFFIRVKDSKCNIIDEVRDVISASYERKYEKLIHGMMYIFEISSKNDSKESKAITQCYQYEGRLKVSCRIYLKENCVHVLHAVTGIDVSEEAKKLKNIGFKSLRDERMTIKTYSLSRAESEAWTAIDSEAKITPRENMITYGKLHDDGWCTEEYILKCSDKKGKEYTSAYSISCQGKSKLKIPFEWTCRKHSRFRRRTVDSGFPDTTDDPQQDSDFSDTDDLYEPRNVPTQGNGDGRSTNLKDFSAPTDAAANPPQPTPNQIPNDAKIASAQLEKPGQVHNNFLHFHNAELVTVHGNNPSVGGNHETNHPPPQHQDAVKTTPMRRDDSHPILPSRGGALEDLSHLGAYGGGLAPVLFHKENEIGLNKQLKASQKKAARVSDTEESEVLLPPQPAGRSKSTPTLRGNISRGATNVVLSTLKKMAK